MTEQDNARRALEEKRKRRTMMARMEADLAYFQARLEFIGEPASANQRAQRKLFKLLHQEIGNRLAATKDKQAKNSA